MGKTPERKQCEVVDDGGELSLTLSINCQARLDSLPASEGAAWEAASQILFVMLDAGYCTSTVSSGLIIPRSEYKKFLALIA